VSLEIIRLNPRLSGKLLNGILKAAKIRAIGLVGDQKIKIERAANFVQSELFARTFSEGMTLVEETANYLDGEGREASKSLSRDAALAYAGASMRLTTQLMQIASWLLVLRAVREEEMGVLEAGDPKYRVKSNDEPHRDLRADGLPEQLVHLIDGANQLFARISRLDGDLFSKEESRSNESDAAGQQRALLRAFGDRS
jgi:regulator of CtrA degradation